MRQPTWSERINEAEAIGEFRKDDRRDAENWCKCAVGEQDPRIPRDHGTPLDRAMSRLGVRFYTAVHENRYDDARELIARIAERAAVVIKSLNAGKGDPSKEKE